MLGQGQENVEGGTWVETGRNIHIPGGGLLLQDLGCSEQYLKYFILNICYWVTQSLGCNTICVEVVLLKNKYNKKYIFGGSYP